MPSFRILRDDGVSDAFTRQCFASYDEAYAELDAIRLRLEQHYKKIKNVDLKFNIPALKKLKFALMQERGTQQFLAMTSLTTPGAYGHLIGRPHRAST